MNDASKLPSQIVRMSEHNPIVSQMLGEYQLGRISYEKMLERIIIAQDRAMMSLRQQLLAQNSRPDHGAVVELGNGD